MRTNTNSGHRAVGALGLAVLMSGCGVAKAATHKGPTPMTTVIVGRSSYTASIKVPRTWAAKESVTTDAGVVPMDIELWPTTKTGMTGVSILGRMQGDAHLPATQHLVFQQSGHRYYQLSQNGSLASVTITVPDTASGKRLARSIMRSWSIRKGGGG